MPPPAPPPRPAPPAPAPAPPPPRPPPPPAAAPQRDERPRIGVEVGRVVARDRVLLRRIGQIDGRLRLGLSRPLGEEDGLVIGREHEIAHLALVVIEELRVGRPEGRQPFEQLIAARRPGRRRPAAARAATRPAAAG